MKFRLTNKPDRTLNNDLELWEIFASTTYEAGDLYLVAAKSWEEASTIFMTFDQAHYYKVSRVQGATVGQRRFIDNKLGKLTKPKVIAFLWGGEWRAY